MRALTLLLTLLVCYSCNGKSGSAKVYTAKSAEDFSRFINQKAMPTSPNLSLDKSVINNEYPIEIALYNDGNFFYDLPNLGTGTGKWAYEDGKIELKASRKIFDMYIEVYGADKDINELAIQFNDRFGANSIKMENHNLESVQ